LGGAGPPGAPHRIVSLNTCADGYLIALADPGQIAALSPYAADPTLSAVADAARAFRRIGWQAESTIPLDPDLVLVGPRDRAMTQRILTALGFHVVEVPFVGTISDARAQIRSVAALLGQAPRGEDLIGKLDAARARLAAAARPDVATALLVEQGGYTEGPTSLAAGLIAEAGLKPPPGAPEGIGGFVSLERLVMMRPDVLVLHSVIGEPHDQGSVYLAHPALRTLYPSSRRIFLPGKYTLCGGPGLIAGLDLLADALARLETQK
jgi:iron complex transport system substrate-binding protein